MPSFEEGFRALGLYMRRKYKDLKCPYCHRIVPNVKYLTKKGCIWCDTTRYKKGDS